MSCEYGCTKRPDSFLQENRVGFGRLRGLGGEGYGEPGRSGGGSVERVDDSDDANVPLNGCDQKSGQEQSSHEKRGQ